MIRFLFYDTQTQTNKTADKTAQKFAYSTPHLTLFLTSIDGFSCVDIKGKI